MFWFNIYMEINSINNQTSFKAKFLNSDSLRRVVEYSVEKGKFDKLNTSRKNIDNSYLRTRLKVDIFEKDGYPTIEFTRYIPKKSVLIAKSGDDYRITKTKTYTSSKKCNLLGFALEKLIKLGNNAPQNNMYKEVVINK